MPQILFKETLAFVNKTPEGTDLQVVFPIDEQNAPTTPTPAVLQNNVQLVSITVKPKNDNRSVGTVELITKLDAEGQPWSPTNGNIGPHTFVALSTTDLGNGLQFTKCVLDYRVRLSPGLFEFLLS